MHKAMAKGEKIEWEKVSLKRCKEILNKNSNKFSDQLISEIRDFLYELAGIDYAAFIHTENKEAIRLSEEAKTGDPTTDQKAPHEKSNSLHPGIDG
jgi:hypothetical protein